MHRILYIDDSPVVRRATSALLSAHGHQIFVAEDGPAGLKELEQNEFDVVITDFSMPGMNGREVASAVKEMRPDVLVILLTGWPIDQLSSPDNRGEDIAMQKPFTVDELNSILNSHRPGRA